LAVPAPEQAPDAQPDQLAQSAPLGHCESLVHQQGTPAAVQLPLGEVTLLQLPTEHVQAVGVAADVSQFSSSCESLSLPEQLLPLHWLFASTHFLLEQFESATQRHAVSPELGTGAGERVVTHWVPPVSLQGTELGAGMHPCPSSEPLPVQFEQLLLWLLGMQCPLAHATSDVQ
jgi:hypothetical protein